MRNIFEKPITSTEATSIQEGDLVHEAPNDKARGLVSEVLRTAKFQGLPRVRLRFAHNGRFCYLEYKASVLITRRG